MFLAVTVIIGDRSKWETNPLFIEAMGGNPIRMIELSEMLDHLQNVSTNYCRFI